MALGESAKRSTTDIIEELRANAEQRFTPPGMGPEAPLGDIIIHGQDIRRPLGLEREIPESRATAVLDMMANKKGKFARPSGAIADLRFEATDAEWSSGTGPTVSGPAEALIMSMSGRAAALDDLGGDGLSEFRSRF